VKEKIASILRRYALARRIYQVVKRLDLRFMIPQITPISGKASRFETSRLNLILPSINEEHFFGGTATALALFEALVSACGEGIGSRLIVTDAAPDKNALKRFSRYLVVSFDADSDAMHQILAIPQRFQRSVYLTPKDRFVASAWWTAYAGQELIAQQKALFGIPMPAMGYVIQDFEPGFYNWSTLYMLAESTYRSEVPTVAIFNTSLLKDFFADKGYLFEKTFFFEPRLNPALIPHLDRREHTRKKQILIYGRPSVERNGFPLIVEALKRWSRRDPRSDQWKILSIGEGHPPVRINDKKVLKSLGKLSLDAYAALLLESAAGISLMISPHPSYPPLEMAHFGLITITNRFANKDLSRFHDNIVSLEKLTPESLCSALMDILQRLEADPSAGTKGIGHMPDYCRQDDPFPFLYELADTLCAS